jgi:hypothetical protein
VDRYLSVLATPSMTFVPSGRRNVARSPAPVIATRRAGADATGRERSHIVISVPAPAATTTAAAT